MIIIGQVRHALWCFNSAACADLWCWEVFVDEKAVTEEYESIETTSQEPLRLETYNN